MDNVFDELEFDANELKGCALKSATTGECVVIDTVPGHPNLVVATNPEAKELGDLLKLVEVHCDKNGVLMCRDRFDLDIDKVLKEAEGTMTTQT